MIASFLIIVLSFLGNLAANAPDGYPWPETLSEWNLFEGQLSELQSSAGVFPYEVNVPLYSDYAHKQRFIRLPQGTSMQYNSKGAFEMPDGAILVKNFFYLSDETHPEAGRRIMETRLLVRNGKQWVAMSYQWNPEQTEAYRAIAGGSADITWIETDGKSQKLHYLIPDANQCKTCHNKNNELLPIGITAKQLNGQGDKNQLIRWDADHTLTGLPSDPSTITRLVDFSDASYSLEQRARSYLDANCAHCHSPEGFARTSGLNLDVYETDPHTIGVMKPPVAAGRGSGGMRYSIVPGKPNKSILLYRMKSTDPGIRMPEINRQIPHQEGIDLITEWIRHMSE